MLKPSINKFSFLVCLFLLCSYAIANEPKVYPCYQMIQKPILDGNPNDPAWNNIPWAEGFTILDTGGVLSKKQTTFKMGYDSTSLYIFVSCEEPNMDNIKAEFGDMGEIWRDDCVEIFFQPEGGDRYYQFVVNSIGSRWNGFYVNKQNVVKKLGDWTAAAFRGNDFWNIELEIPFAFLESKTRGEWRGNIARSIRSGQEQANTTWSDMASGYHELSSFGRFVFMEETLTEEQAVIVEKTINGSAHNRIELEIKKILDEMYGWRTLFEKASDNQRSRDSVRVMALIDSFSKENQNIEELTLSEKIILLDKAKIVYNEAGKLRSRLMLEMLIFGEF